MHLGPLKSHGTRNLVGNFQKVCGHANFLIVATWNGEHSPLLVDRKSLLFRVDQLAVEGMPYIGPIRLAKTNSCPACSFRCTS